MPLRQCMQAHTYREYKVWMDWFEEEWNSPTLTHYYLMQIAQEVARVLAKHPRKIKLEQFKLKFSRKDSSTLDSRSYKRRMAQFAKAKWGLVTGLIKPRNKRAK